MGRLSHVFRAYVSTRRRSRDVYSTSSPEAACLAEAIQKTRPGNGGAGIMAWAYVNNEGLINSGGSQAAHWQAQHWASIYYRVCLCVDAGCRF